MTSNLLFSSLNGSSRIRIIEPAALLPVLQSRRNARADALSLAVVGAAGNGLVAVGVGDAAARDELCALAVSYVACAGVVGDDLG